MSQALKNIKFSIIICTYNRERFLPFVLKSVVEQTLAKDLFEVIIINNNSTDSTPEICEDFIKKNPSINVGYHNESLQGLSYARNRGIKESSGEVITFMDDDAILTPDFCKVTLDFFLNHKSVSAVGGKILLQYMKEKPYWYNPFLASLLGYFNHGDKERPFTGDYFRGSNMSFRRKLFLSHSPFSTDLGRVGKNLAGSEEKELFYRLKKAGEEIWYIPDAVVYHLVPEERCTLSFIREQGKGAGKSQKKMMQSRSPFAYYTSLGKEAGKWIVTFLIALFYLLSLRPGIASVLIQFRYAVSCGLFSRS